MSDNDMSEFMGNDGAQPLRCTAGAEAIRKIVQNAAHPDKNIIIFKGESIFYFIIVGEINFYFIRERCFKICRNDMIDFFGNRRSFLCNAIKSVVIDNAKMLGLEFFPMKFGMIASGGNVEL